MNMLKRTLTGILAVLMCLGVCFGAVACSNATDNPADTNPESNPIIGVDETNPDTVGETEESLDLPSDLNFNNAEINIYCEKDCVDLIGSVDGDVVEAAIHERNISVQDRLKVKLNMIELSGDDYYGTLRTLITANDDSVDIVSGMQFFAIPQAVQGLYRDVSNFSYFDWDKSWWGDEYMNTIQLNEKRYCIIGDISLRMLKAMSAFYVNKSILKDEINGSIDDIYEDVFNGTWTWDAMTTYVSQVNRDVNGNQIADAGDIMGMRGYAASPVDHMAYTAGFALSTRDANGTIELIADQAHNIEVVEAIRKLMWENPGCLISTEDNFQEHFLDSFAAGTTLFCAYNLEGADFFRNMTDEYAIIPHPKFDMNQTNYKTLVHDYATTFSIPISVGDEEAEMFSAVLEAMCYESYKKVTPVYYDVVLKTRYSSDPNSARAIDIIRENIMTDFIYANNYSLSAGLGVMPRELVGSNNTNYMSTYTKYSRLVGRDLDMLD